MPDSIISNNPTIYQFGSHIQYLSVVSAVFTAFTHCKAIFATNAFNFDCLQTMYITTIIIIIVINAVVKRSMSTKTYFRKEPNLELFFASSISFCPFIFRISLLFLYWTTRSFSVFGVLSRLGSNLKVSMEIGRICSWVVQFFQNRDA